MDGFWLTVLMRFLHVASAVVALGATFCMLAVVLPAALGASGGATVLAAVRPRLKRVVHGAFGVLLLSGFYNYLLVAAPKLRRLTDAAAAGSGAPEAVARLAPYHPVMGVKVVLALLLFAFAIMLLKPVPAFERKRGTWLAVNAILWFTIVLLGAYLRRLWP